MKNDEYMQDCIKRAKTIMEKEHLKLFQSDLVLIATTLYNSEVKK